MLTGPLGMSLPRVTESHTKLGDEKQGSRELSWVHVAGWAPGQHPRLIPKPGLPSTNPPAYLLMSVLARDPVRGHPRPGFALLIAATPAQKDSYCLHRYSEKLKISGRETSSCEVQLLESQNLSHKESSKSKHGHFTSKYTEPLLMMVIN